MVRIKSQDMVFDNGALDMAMNLLHVQQCEWNNCPKENLFLDFRENLYEDEKDKWKVTGFECIEEFVERDFETGEIKGPVYELNMFPIEKLTKWDLDGYIEYPLINIKSIKFYPDTCNNLGKDTPCITIEIESDNDEAVREIFTVLACLANGGHCCGGYIRINKNQMLHGGHVATFGLDGDGLDSIYYVDDKEMPK